MKKCKIYKFGGASVKNAESIGNVLEVIEKTDFKEGVIVVSAMGKTTNALETLVQLYQDNENYQKEFQALKEFHFEILHDLFPTFHPVFDAVEQWFVHLENFLQYNKSQEYNFVYDQIVSYGELISTTIVSQFLQLKSVENQWLDAREYIKSDNSYREGQVDWQVTQQNLDLLSESKIYVTQGFIASDSNNFNVTLGREGSDFSAAIIAYCLDASSLTIWKDVEGVLNADPRYFDSTLLLQKISYQEAVEMAFYGASVIHPKTIKPLENKKIPFYVKSFLNPTHSGTEISKGVMIEPLIPCYIRKTQQHLVHISPKDFSFISEYHMSAIFECLSKYKIKISMIQISAISLNLCLEDKFNRLDQFLSEITATFFIQSIPEVSLYTIRHFDAESRTTIIEGKELLLEQIVKETLQIVVKE